MGSTQLYVGIDVHKRVQVSTILSLPVLKNKSNEWKKVKPILIKNNIKDYESLHKAIHRQAKDASSVSIAVDRTGSYSLPIVHFLVSKEYKVYFLTNQSVKAAKERLLKEENKTDKLDSAILAYLMYLRDYHGLSLNISATQPDLESHASLLRSLVLQRAQYVRLEVQATNRLHQYFFVVFPEGEMNYFSQLLRIAPYYPTPRDILCNGLNGIEKITEKDRKSIIALAQDTIGVPGEPYHWIISDLCEQRSDAHLKVLLISRQIKKEVDAHPYGPILRSFPFVGDVIAATLIGIVKDISYWPNDKTLKKVLGVYGREYISGASPPVRRPGKSGNRAGKVALFQACIGCIKKTSPNNDFKDYYERQISHNKIWIQAMANTSGKMAEIMYHCLKTGVKYQYQGKYKGP